MSAADLLRHLVGAFRMPAPQAIRAGMLNTGELVLIDGRGAVQVLSAEATDTVRDVLFADDLAVSERVMLDAASGSIAAGGTD